MGDLFNGELHHLLEFYMNKLIQAAATPGIFSIGRELLVLAALCGLVGCAVVGYMGDDNVVRHVSGHGVLIQGTGCIINDTPEVSDEEMLAIAVFCITNRTH
jgi:hypothetical protein